MINRYVKGPCKMHVSFCGFYVCLAGLYQLFRVCVIECEREK